MLRSKQVLWVVTRAQVRVRGACGSIRCENLARSRAWLSATDGGESRGADDPTPAQTKLAFTSTIYGKDPAAGAELTASEVAVVDRLRRAAVKPDEASSSKGSDPRAMFDSALSQQTADGKASGDIKREVATDTPDATRLAFRASNYGKDSQLAAAISEEDTKELEKLRARAKNAGATSNGAAPVHDSRNLFDSDLVHGSGTTAAYGDIKRDVVAGTPDATRIAFRASAYGKDPQAATELSAQEAFKVKALRDALARHVGAAGSTVAPVHDDRSMFDSDLEHSLGTSVTSDSIKRDVVADTPDATRLAFRAEVYGKDPHAAAALSEEEAAKVEALLEAATGVDVATGAAPVHHDRSMFDSDHEHGVGATEEYDSIKRDVLSDTPEVTRVVFGGSDYGKDPRSMLRTAEEQVAVDDLAARARHESEASVEARRWQAPVHHERSMYDSDLTQGSGAMLEFEAIKRLVEPGTPPLTRLSFFDNTCEFHSLLDQTPLRKARAAKANENHPLGLELLKRRRSRVALAVEEHGPR